MKGLAVAAAGCLTIAACADNAILEVELDLPPRPSTTPLYAFVQARAADKFPLPDPWGGSDLGAVELGDARYVDSISLLTSETNVDVNIKVRFCEDPRCTSIPDDNAPECWFHLEHPFYVGKRTFWSARVAAIPMDGDAHHRTEVLVDRCQIRGCVEGDLSDYCRVDGRHLCED